MPERLKLRKSTWDRKITYVGFLIFFILMLIPYLSPLIWAFISSFKTGAEFFESPFALPEKWNFINYVNVFSDFRYRQFTYLDMLWNSLWMLVVRIIVNVSSSACLAYAVSRYRFPGRSLIYGLVIFANTIPIIGSGAAAFKLAAELNMVNNPFLIWLKWAGGFDFAFIVFYGYFKGISRAYSESAKIDGAGNYTVLFKIIAPQAFPCIAAIAITQSVGIWNDYSTVMIYMREYPNLAYGLFVFNKEANYVENSRAIYLAALVISAIPILVLYGSNLKLILKNVTTGGLKG